MSKLLLIRHGETNWNLEQKLQGHTDIPLNQNGISQARLLEAKLSNEFQIPADKVVYSSSLSRAHQTAQICFPLSQIKTDDRLKELNLGIAEGHGRQEVAKNLAPAIWEQWNSLNFEDFHASFPQGESRIQGISRLCDFISSASPCDPLICFSHGLIIRTWAQWCTNQVTRFQTPNCSVFEFEIRTQNLNPKSTPDERPLFIRSWSLL